MSSNAHADLIKPFNSLFRNGDWDEYLSLLENQGLIWAFELDLPSLFAHLVPLNQMPKDTAIPPRISFFSEIMEPFVSLETIDGYYALFKDQGDHEAAAAAVLAGINTITESGNDYSRLKPWHKKSHDLLADIPALARSSLLSQRGAVRHILQGEMEQAEKVISEALGQAELAGSDSLRVLVAANLVYPLIFMGRFAEAEMRIFDAAPLCELEHVSGTAKLPFLMIHAALRCFMGDVEEGKAALAAIVNDPNYNCLPPTPWLYGQGHYMFAASLAGNGREAQAIARRIQELAVPENNYYFRAYLQFNLAISCLAVDEPAKALVHIRESDRLVPFHKSFSGSISNAPVTGQTLALMGRDQEALDHFSEWHERWLRAGCYFLASTGDIETAAILAKQGRIDRAREHFSRAESLMAEGRATHFIRPPAFTEKLRHRLYPESAPPASLPDWEESPIRIRTFGGLRVHVNGRTIHDRKWRGKRTKSLLKALIVFNGNKVSTDRVLDLLWPDEDGQKATQNLKSAIYRLKRIGLEKGEAPLPWIKVRDRRITLDPSLCQVDSIRFSKALSNALTTNGDRSLLPRALDLYTEDFLPQDINAAWIIEHRKSLLDRYLEGVSKLAEYYLTEGRVSDALPHLLKAVGTSTPREETFGLLMRIHLELGYPSQALEVYEQARDRLSETLDLEPGPALANLARQARGLG